MHLSPLMPGRILEKNTEYNIICQVNRNRTSQLGPDCTNLRETGSNILQVKRSLANHESFQRLNTLTAYRN